MACAMQSDRLVISRGGGRWNGVVSQCGWGRFFVNDGQSFAVLTIIS